jgi:signal recognition particle receptor subunit beta/uncharacterized protein YoxC
MAYLNVKERVIEAKIVYYGAGLSGKTTNLEQVKRLSTDGRCGDMMTLETDGDRTLFFDWLPFNIGKFNGCDVKMQLYTVPGQTQYAETRKRVLAGADGVVLVLDSQSGALDKNRQTLGDLREHLRANGLAAEIPIVVQLNKRDLPSAMAPDELLREVGLGEMPYVEAIASRGERVFETLREASRLVLQAIRESARVRSPELKTGTSSGLDGNTLYTKLAPEAAPVSAPTVAAQVATAVTAATAGTAATAATATSVAITPAVSSAAPGNGAAPQSVRAQTGPASRQAPTPGGGNGAGASAASPTQLGEIVTALRTVSRRVDGLEATIGASVSASLADFERRLLAKLDPKELRRALDGELAAVREEVRAAASAGASAATSHAARLDAAAEASARTAEALARVEAALGAHVAEAREQTVSLGAEIAALARVVSDVSAAVRALGASQVTRDAFADQHARLGASLAKLADASPTRESLDAKLSAVAGSIVVELQATQSSFEDLARRTAEGSTRELLDAVRAAEGRLDGAQARRLAPLATMPDAIAAGAASTVAALQSASGELRSDFDARISMVTTEMRAQRDADAIARARLPADLEKQLAPAQRRLHDDVGRAAEGQRELLAELGKRLDAQAVDAGKRHDATSKQLDRVVGAVSAAMARAHEAQDSLTAALRELASVVASVAKDVVGLSANVDTRLAPLLDAEKRLASVVDARANWTVQQVCDARELVARAVGTVEGRVRELTESFQAALSDANQKKGWWR